MSKTPFIISIDTEGDDLWARPHEISTLNAAYLPRFQALCERFRFRPVYLTNFEMATSSAFVEFGRDVIARDAGEIGMHLHAWNSPPLYPLTGDDLRYQPYLIEYPEHVMKEKIHFLTRLLEDRFDRRMVSHRAGRWAFDARYAAMLLNEGYRVDCSVTPGIDWRRNRGNPAANGGTDYRSFPERPYFLDQADISRKAESGLLEVPVTVRPSALHRRAPFAYKTPMVRRFANMASPGLRWLCPSQSSLKSMLQVACEAHADGVDHLEFMLHSSELMPGGSENYRDEAAIERLYEEMEMVFEAVSPFCTGMTLTEFSAQFAESHRKSRSGASAGSASEPRVSPELAGT